MRASLEQSDRDFLAELHRRGQVSISELCLAMKVTATAVRQRLVRLQAAGLVDRNVVRGERGRPHYLYGVSQEGLNRLGDNYRELALLLWDEIQQIEEPDLKSRMVNKLRQSLVKAYGESVRSENTGERMEELRRGLARRGFDVELKAGAADGLLPVLRENACPYHELAMKDSSICDLEETVFSEIVGVPIRRSQCCRDGHSCCEFAPVG